MKSIMEEASSIMEAIQKGWDRAGKPHEFSVKVFEDAETSFFGMRTVKSAKIALFYQEGAPSFTTEKADSSNRPAKSNHPSRRSDDRRDSSRATGHDRRDERSPRTHDRVDRPARAERPERAPRPLRETSHSSTSGQVGQAERVERPMPAPQKPRELRPLADSSALPREASGQAGQTEIAPRGGAWNEEMITWVNGWIRQTLAHAGHANVDFTTESSRNLLRIDFSAPITGDEKQERILFSSFAHLIMSSLRNKFKGDLKHLKVVLNSR